MIESANFFEQNFLVTLMSSVIFASSKKYLFLLAIAEILQVESFILNGEH